MLTRRMDDILKAAIEGRAPPEARQEFNKLLDGVEAGLRSEPDAPKHGEP